MVITDYKFIKLSLGFDLVEMPWTLFNDNSIFLPVASVINMV